MYLIQYFYDWIYYDKLYKLINDNLCFNIKNVILSYLIVECNNKNYINNCFYKNENTLYCMKNIKFMKGYFHNNEITGISIKYNEVIYYGYKFVNKFSKNVKKINLYNLYDCPKLCNRYDGITEFNINEYIKIRKDILNYTIQLINIYSHYDYKINNNKMDFCTKKI